MACISLPTYKKRFVLGLSRMVTRHFRFCTVYTAGGNVALPLRLSYRSEKCYFFDSLVSIHPISGTLRTREGRVKEWSNCSREIRVVLWLSEGSRGIQKTVAKRFRPDREMSGAGIALDYTECLPVQLILTLSKSYWHCPNHIDIMSGWVARYVNFPLFSLRHVGQIHSPPVDWSFLKDSLFIVKSCSFWFYCCAYTWLLLLLFLAVCEGLKSILIVCFRARVLWCQSISKTFIVGMYTLRHSTTDVL